MLGVGAKSESGGFEVPSFSGIFPGAMGMRVGQARKKKPTPKLVPKIYNGGGVIICLRHPHSPLLSSALGGAVCCLALTSAFNARLFLSICALVCVPFVVYFRHELAVCTKSGLSLSTISISPEAPREATGQLRSDASFTRLAVVSYTCVPPSPSRSNPSMSLLLRRETSSRICSGDAGVG